MWPFGKGTSAHNREGKIAVAKLQVHDPAPTATQTSVSFPQLTAGLKTRFPWSLRTDRACDKRFKACSSGPPGPNTSVGRLASILPFTK